MKHVMIDLETWGTRPGNAIMAIGAVAFDATGILDKFMVRISTSSCLALGLTIDGDTLDWWFDPARDPARAELAKFEQHDIINALYGVMDWIRQIPADELGGVWGNGALMDNNMLLAACERANIEPAWTYKQDRCYRTVKSMAPEVPFESVGTHHNPVDDAEGQALHLIAVCKDLEIVL